MVLAGCGGEEGIVADAGEPARPGVEGVAADKVVGAGGHDMMASGVGLAVILVAEGDPGLVEPEETAVRYGDPVGVARGVSEHHLGPGARRLGIDDPALLADRREVPQESAPFGEMREAAK